MGKNNRLRRTSQRPSASKTHLSPGSGSPQDGERILLDEGCQQLLYVCSPRSLRGAIWQVYTAWIKGELPVWRDGKLADPDEYSFGVRTDVDGRERLKIRKGTDAVTTSGDRLLGIDQSNHKWETSTVAIAALRERLIKEQLPAARLQVEVIKMPEIRTVAVQPETPAPPRQVTAIEWLTLEAQRLKRCNMIPVGISMTAFAEMLESNMREAARTGRSVLISPVGSRHILNHLREWALWPISAIE